MQFSLETVARFYAAGRNQVNQVLGFAAGVGVITVAQDQGAMDAIDQIGKGLSMVFHGATSLYSIGVVVLGPAVGWVLTWYAQRSAKTVNQAAAVKAAVVDPNTPISPETKATIVDAAIQVTKS
jgi:predicted NBD/HSP70 family sugar kinase